MDSEFVEYALHQLQVLGPVVARKMFGFRVLSCDERNFAVIHEDALYFKVDALSRLEYVAAGMEPFSPPQGKVGMDGYFEVPLEVLGAREKLAQWGRKALAAAAPAAAPSAADSLASLGSVSQRWLAEAGIRTRAELERIGSVAAFKKVAAAGREPSVNLLYALEGALLGLRPQRLSAAVKKNLLERAGLAAPKKSAKPRSKRSR